MSDSLAKMAIFYNPTEAQLAQSHLESAGIRVTLSRGGLPGIFGENSGEHVLLVDANDVERAKEVLQTLPQDPNIVQTSKSENNRTPPKTRATSSLRFPTQRTRMRERRVSQELLAGSCCHFRSTLFGFCSNLSPRVRGSIPASVAGPGAPWSVTCQSW